MENWKQIEDYNYEISDLGNVRNMKTKRILSQRRLTGSAYFSSFIEINGKQKARDIHRLVCIAFKSTEDKTLYAHHLDGDKFNNKAENLEWVTPSQNLQHSYDTGLKMYRPLHYKGKFGSDHNRSKSVRCIETGIIYGSMSEASRKLKINHSSVSWSVKYKKPIFGMHFEIGI